MSSSKGLRVQHGTLQKQLLKWFDRHRRVMPWRALKGRTPDPYHVWLSEIMLQQTTVVTVGPYFMKFVKKWPTVEKLAKAKLDDVLAAWAGLGYYARARNLHKCAQAVMKDFGGKFPDNEDGLIKLPGIGPYTAAAVASIAFNHPAVAVDGNVERVVSRFFAIEEPLPQSKRALRARAAELAEDNPCPSDFTQGFMELGATVCTPKKPKCAACPWQKSCAAHRLGIAEELPRKTAAAQKPVRYGRVFWIEKSPKKFLIEKRAGKGLYEGLYQLPTTDWTDKAVAPGKNYDARLRFRRLDADVRHSFTHFDLVLEIWTARAGASFRPGKGKFISADELENYALPSLMHKVVKLCLGGYASTLSAAKSA
ncbi:MAG: A/G-specific adenine glycosylase [Alphaproteobacteria bacterium]|nr:A/G-specific adenine glycosylase [Alphaproteobacteria bacterium]